MSLTRPWALRKLHHEIGWSTYGLSQARRYNLELNWHAAGACVARTVREDFKRYWRACDPTREQNTQQCAMTMCSRLYTPALVTFQWWWCNSRFFCGRRVCHSGNSLTVTNSESYSAPSHNLHHHAWSVSYNCQQDTTLSDLQVLPTALKHCAHSGKIFPVIQHPAT